MSTAGGNIDYQALLKEGYLQLKAMRQRLEVLERSRNEPIAIVGIGCRFPGGGSGPAGFWRMLSDGVDATRDVPPGRWDVDAYYDPHPDASGRMYVRRGAFLDGVDRFDPSFFGISPREATSMDPQQRLLLEVAWEAVEDAAIPRDVLAGTATGVYVGVMFHDYAHLVASAGLQHIDTYFGTGNGVAFLAGRLSHYLGLQGPSLVLDTACSSSLVAVHLACQSLRSGETDLALACGVNLILSPLSSVVMCRLRALAPDGRCKTFDASADGYARGEGCGVVVLKRLSDAQAAGDRIWAVVRGSAVNQDGAGAGITVPNGLAQQAVIRKAMAEAKIEPSQIGYVEAHGTGTRLGDPLELRSLWSVLKPGRDADSPIVVGSLKTNVGHMEGAAGIGSLIKTVLALRHGTIPPHLHLKHLNPLIADEGMALQIPQEALPWPRISGARIAGVSSFGMSGTNAHAILEAAPSQATTSAASRAPGEAPASSLRSRGSAGGENGQHGLSSTPASLADVPDAYSLCVSARSEPELRELATRYRDYLRASPEGRLQDICFTAAAGRTHWDYRLAIVANDLPSCERKLEAWLSGSPEDGVWHGKAPTVEVPGTAQATDPEQIARQYVSGARLDGLSFYKGRSCAKVSLPTYPFNRQRYWVELPLPTASAKAEPGEPLEHLLYEVKWHSQDLPVVAPSAPAGSRFLLLTDGQSLDRQLQHHLQQQGEPCFSNDSLLAADIDAAVATALADANGRPLDVVYLRGAVADESLTSQTLQACERVIWPGLLRTMQALMRAAATHGIRLWVVTRGVHVVRPEDHSCQPSGSGLWGLGKVFSLEHPDVWGGLIDLPGSASDDDAKHLLDEIRSRGGEDQVAYRQGRRFVARLEPISRALPAAEVRFDPDGVYWIAGGLGAVGLQTAEWMVGRGARCLVLQGRTGLPPRDMWTASTLDEQTRRRVDGVRALEALGAAVHVLAVDVAGAEFLSQAMNLLDSLARPLKGVFHAAGVSGLRPLAEMTSDELRSVLAAKVTGLWNLHQLAARFPEACFACFSSIASVWGSRFLGHYAAANAFLDALMHYRHARGLPGLSVNWGPLAGGGMDLAHEEERLRRLGIRTLPAVRVGVLLGRLLNSDEAQAIAVDVDWRVFKPIYEAQRPRLFLASIVAAPEVVAPAAAPDRQRLLAADGPQRLALAEGFLLAQAAAVLQAAESDLSPAEPLTALGVDSLMAMELQKRLQTGIGVDVPVSVFLQGATLGQLAQRVVAGLMDSAAATPDAPEMVEGDL